MGHNHDATVLRWKAPASQPWASSQPLASSHPPASSQPLASLLPALSQPPASQPQSPHSTSSEDSVSQNSGTDESVNSCGEDVAIANIQATQPSYILVMDNLDKNITPRFMTASHQTQSLHW